MKCPTCGMELNEEYKFCPHCGARLNEPAAEETAAPPEADAPEKLEAAAEPEAPEEGAEPEVSEESAETEAAEQSTERESGETEDKSAGAKQPLKTTLRHIASVLGVLLLTVLIVVLSGGRGRYTASGSRLVMLYGEGETYFVDGKNKPVTLEGTDYSLSNSLTGESSAILEYVDGELYICENGRLRLIASDVLDVRMAMSGEGAAYLSDDGELFLYRGGRSVKIASEVMENYFCISPDGKTVGYTRTDERGRPLACVYKGRERVVAENRLMLALSDGAKYIYFSSADGTKLYVQRGLKASTATKIGSDYLAFLLNGDYSEAVVLDYSNVLSLSVKGGESEKIASGFIKFVLPQQTLYYYSGVCAAVGLDSFENIFLLRSAESGQRLCYLNSRGELSTVARGVSDAVVLDDGRTLIYLKDGVLFKTDGSAENAKKTELFDGVQDFTVSGDGRTLYCTNLDYELLHLTSRGGARVVAEEFYGYCGGILFGDNKAYFEYDGAVGVDNGKSRSVVRLDGEVSYVSCFGDFIYVDVLDDGVETQYISTDGRNYIRLGK